MWCWCSTTTTSSRRATIHDGMAFLLEHLPPQVHLVLASRADPPLPLARLRGRGELVEIRAADLRFTADEAAEYLNEVMGLDLTAEDVAALETADRRVDHRDPAGGALDAGPTTTSPASSPGSPGTTATSSTTWPRRSCSASPKHLRTFLLQTSILSRLNGSLCEAVTGQHGGQAMLEALDRGNLFLVPLDDRRQWYRYHHLFRRRSAGAPAGRAARRSCLLCTGGRATGMSRTASGPEAVRHAMAGEHFERAAELVELAIPALRQGRQDATLLRWLEALPDEVVRVRPVLSIEFVGALMTVGKLEGVEARLRDAERWLDAATADRWWWTRWPSAAYPASSPCIGQDLPSSAAMWPAR